MFCGWKCLCRELALMAHFREAAGRNFSLSFQDRYLSPQMSVDPPIDLTIWNLTWTSDNFHVRMWLMLVSQHEQTAPTFFLLFCFRFFLKIKTRRILQGPFSMQINNTNKISSLMDCQTVTFRIQNSLSSHRWVITYVHIAFGKIFRRLSNIIILYKINKRKINEIIFQLFANPFLAASRRLRLYLLNGR